MKREELEFRSGLSAREIRYLVTEGVIPQSHIKGGKSTEDAWDETHLRASVVASAFSECSKTQNMMILMRVLPQSFIDGLLAIAYEDITAEQRKSKFKSAVQTTFLSQDSGDSAMNAIHTTGFLTVTPVNPQKKISYDVSFDGPIGTITITRVIENDESTPIEASATFPIPFDAVVTNISIDIDGRRLKGVAQGKTQARKTYEDGLDRGKAAFLHEEILRGLHMISAGQIAPKSKAIISLQCVAPLCFIAGKARLEIPVTIGDIYGESSRIHISDRPEISDNATLEAEIVVHDSGVGAKLVGTSPVMLNQPIIIELDKETFETQGCLADGRGFSLKAEVLPSSDNNLDIVLLCDKSGSMSDQWGKNGRSVHDVVQHSLIKIAPHLQAADHFAIYQFNDDLVHVKACNGSDFSASINLLSKPSGCTEIGRSLKGVAKLSPSKDILIITDGRTHMADIGEALTANTRIFALLVGAGTLNSEVGHLVAMTGGQMLVTTPDYVEDALKSILQSMRISGTMVTSGMSLEKGFSFDRGCARFTVKPNPGCDDDKPVKGFIASILMNTVSVEDAENLAISNGIVSHLTSLVVVDEEGISVEGMSVHRKIGLSTPLGMLRSASIGASPSTALFASSQNMFAESSLNTNCMMMSGHSHDSNIPNLALNRMKIGFSHNIEDDSLKMNHLSFGDDILPSYHRPINIPMSIRMLIVDWDRNGNAIMNNPSLCKDVVLWVDNHGGEIKRLAATYKINPYLFVIGVLAYRDRAKSRLVFRISDRILHPLSDAQKEQALSML